MRLLKGLCKNLRVFAEMGRNLNVDGDIQWDH